MVADLIVPPHPPQKSCEWEKEEEGRVSFQLKSRWHVKNSVEQCIGTINSS